jgi:hypothetical protein
MNETVVNELFSRFAAPLVPFVQLGADVEAAEALARNLWIAMICGGETEQQVWDQLHAANSELFDILRRCYADQMRPTVDDETLARLREWYFDQDDEPA